MELKIKDLETALCNSLCANIKIVETGNSYAIETPFYFPDGDMYEIYLKPLPQGGFRILDGAHTLMHLSYENDIEKFKHGQRNLLLENIKSELDINEDNGEFFIDCNATNIADNIIKFGQAITKINDLTFLNKTRIQKTFYEDLRNELFEIVQKEKITENFIFEKLDDPKLYPIDYKINTKNNNDYFFVFGISNKDKAQLVNIIMERLLRMSNEKHFNYDSLIVFENTNELDNKTRNRLINVGGEIITSLNNNKDNFRKKVLKQVA